MRVWSRVAVPVAVIPWPEAPARATVVVKVSFEIKRWGTAVRAERPDPLTPDTWADSGVLLFPSDFSRLKTKCDVLVVGRALTLGPAPAKLRATGFLKAVDHAAALGPVPDAQASTPIAQRAPLDQRVPPPRLPLRLRYERMDDIIEAFLPGPIPQIAVIRRGELSLVPAPVDTLALDPDRKRVMITVRAAIDDLDRASELVIDETATLPDSWGGAASVPGSSPWHSAEAAIVGAELPPPPSASAFRSVPPGPPLAAHQAVAGSGVSSVRAPDQPVPSLAPPGSLTPESDAVETLPRPRSPAPTQPHGTAAMHRAARLPLVPQTPSTAPPPDSTRPLAEQPATFAAAPIAPTQLTQDVLPMAFDRGRPLDVTLPTATDLPSVGLDQTAAPVLLRNAAKTVDGAFQRSKSVTLPFQRNRAPLPLAKPSFGIMEETTQIAPEPKPDSRPAALPFAQGTAIGDSRAPNVSAATSTAVAPTTIAHTTVAHAAVLPFGVPVGPLSPEPILPFRAKPPAAPAPVAEAPSFGSSSPTTDGVPTEPAAAPTAHAALPFAQGFDLRAVDLTPAALRIPEPAVQVAVVPKAVSSSELSLERYTAIRAEIWANKEPRRAILKRHGLSELKWRMAERRLSDKLAEDKSGASVAAALATLSVR